MSQALGEFIERFVLPLLGGGEVSLRGPIRPAEVRRMQEESAELASPELRFLRLRRATELVSSPDLPDPDADELALWIGIHNLLVFDHPDRDRVWARSVTWARMESAVRQLLTLPRPMSAGEGHARHVAVESLLALTRTDVVIPTPRGELRLRGQALPRRRVGLGVMARPGPREEVVRWVDQPHAPETRELLSALMGASPLTCLLRPELAPASWSPVDAPGYLLDRAHARAVCHAWARDRDWVAVGARVTDALLRSDPGDVSLTAVGAVVSALIHVHFLRVLELEARLGLGLGLGSREPGVSAFLAIPLLLPRISEVVGTPLDDSAPAAVRRRWAEHLEHLEELAAPATLENLVASLVPRIVQTA